MRLLGAVLLWISLIYAGVIYSTKLNKRITLLKKTILMFEEMKILLEYLNTPVYDLVSIAEDKDYFRDLKFLYLCCDYLKKGADFPDAWKKAIDESATIYTTQEKEHLLQLGENLGTSNKEGQIKLLNMQIVSFEDFLQKAKHKRKKYAGTAKALGLLSGCMIFILAI